jgi:hypothetical protein
MFPGGVPVETVVNQTSTTDPCSDFTIYYFGGD